MKKEVVSGIACIALFSGCSGPASERQVSDVPTRDGVITEQFDALDRAQGTVDDAVAQKNEQIEDALGKDNTLDEKTMEKDYSRVPEEVDMSLAQTCTGATITTNQGVVKVNLFGEKAPIAVANFCTLAKKGFYDGVIFHRVIQGFMIQGGDPTGTGTGGPGYQFEDELPGAGEYKLGSLAMANAGPDTNGSQFFVVSGQNGVQLPPLYTLFGEVVEGMEVVSAIEQLPTAAMDKPVDDVVIEKIEI
jgi:cyclophilin family peptidyl-prolyl cis-trans isomerase